MNPNPEPKQQSPPTEIERICGSRGLVPNDFEGMWRFAVMVAKSGLAPQSLDSAEKVVVAMQFGMELGLTPMQAVQGIYVVNGRPSLWGDALWSLVISHPQCVDARESVEGEGEAAVATCALTRTGKASPIVRRFSVADAKRAGLWGKKGPWISYPKRMLQMRARSWAARDAFPDALKGIAMAEEQIDIPAAVTVSDSRPKAERLADRLAGEERPAAPCHKEPEAAASDSEPRKLFDADEANGAPPPDLKEKRTRARKVCADLDESVLHALLKKSGLKSIAGLSFAKEETVDAFLAEAETRLSKGAPV